MGGCAKVENTSELFAGTGANDWVTLRGPADLPKLPAGLPNDLKARIAADLRSGLTVVAPRQPITPGPGASASVAPAAGWWRIDPHTGQCLGIGQQGWGVSTVETAGILRAILSYAAMSFCVLGIMTAKIAAGAKVALVVACAAAGAMGAASNLIGAGLSSAGMTASGVAGVVGVFADILSLAGAAGGYFGGQ